MFFPKIDEHLRNAARGLDIALTDHSQNEKGWFFNLFKKDEKLYYQNFRDLIYRLEKGDITEQFPKGLKIHPLSLLLLRAMTALANINSDPPYYFWRSYLLFIFWSDAIRRSSEFKNFNKSCFRRLRDPEAFAGAMFEVLMTFCLSRIFEVGVAFGEDPPDLLVFAPKTGHQYAVECKMLSGLTERQKMLSKIEYLFSYQVLSFLRKSRQPVFVWWTFNSMPKEIDVAEKASDCAKKLCQEKMKNKTAREEHELEKGLGKVIVIDLPKELILSEAETGDPRPPLTWRPSGVPERGEIIYNNRNKLIDDRMVVSARTAVHLAQNPALKENLSDSLDVARKQLRCVNSSGIKKVIAIGLRIEAPNRLEEAKASVSSYLAGHGELSGIYLVTSPGSAYMSSVVDCTDISRVGLNAASVHCEGIIRAGCNNDVPIQEIIVFQANKTNQEIIVFQANKTKI